MYSTIKTYLQESLSGELPGMAAHAKMLPPGRRMNSQTHELSAVKMSSVLLLLYPDNDQLYVCLTKRPSTMKYHPGQISFPGGRVEKEDISAEMTALREAREEVGLDPDTIEILGKLTDLFVEVSMFSIQPFLAWANKKPELSMNTGEVERLLLFPISKFVLDERIVETELQTVTGPLRVKHYPFDGEIIWGATAMILSELIEILKNHQN